MRMPTALLYLGLCLSLDLGATEYARPALPPPDLQAIPEPPPMPEPIESGEVMEADITIIQRQYEVVHEYRRQGRLYMVKVIPDIGPAYYLVDTDGNGDLETRLHEEFDSGLLIPAWVLLSWD